MDEPTPEPPVSTSPAAPPESSPPPARVQIRVEFDSLVNYALQQNDVPIVHALHLENSTATDLEDLRVRIRIEPDEVASAEHRVSRLTSGIPLTLETPRLPVSAGRLKNLEERERCELHIEVLSHEGERLGEHREDLTLLAYNEWGGTTSLPELLAAFVMPNHPAISRMLRRASDFLGKATGSPSLDGYQSRDPERVLAMAQAIYKALQAESITYSSPPPSFEVNGQKVLTPEKILDEKMGTCLDLSVLYAAVLERAGLHPVLVLVEGHAMTALWLLEDFFPDVTIEGEAAILRNRIALGHLCILDVTSVSARPPVGFEASEQSGRRQLENPGNFFALVDIAAARRHGKILPLPARVTPGSEDPGEAPVEEVQFTAPGARGTIRTPIGPRSAIDETAREKAPATRVDQWMARLLDLTYRNRLLNFRSGSSNLELEVPDLGALEDGLAAGKSYNLEALPRTIRGPERDEEAVRARTGETPREGKVREFFEAGTLVAELDFENLQTRLTKIYRNARSSLEESGANTLYLTLGALRFYESPTAEKPRLAPLIVMPVELERLKGGKRFRVRRTDEDSRVNLTLLEKLWTDFRIEVPGLDPLPEDESGLDVYYILGSFRQAILDKGGWEVVERVDLTSLSFTKFLMWKDLGDRREDLLESPVVRHLVETPSETFDRGDDFPDPNRLDHERRAAETFCPLDADSSQLAAVYAAADGKSFVLDGPPGTGKSQTITNLICHTLARGKTVLFVAEKRAALEVVYDRLRTVGLEPFCLELHSNKVTKRHVLEQLQRVLELGRIQEHQDWERRTRELEETRHELNETVDTLHRPREIGKSVFRVTAELIRLRDVPEIAIGPFLRAPLTESSLERARAAVDALTESARDVDHPPASPWRACRIERWSQALERQVREILQSLPGLLHEVRDGKKQFEYAVGLTLERAHKEEIAAASELDGLLTRPRPGARNLLEEPDWAACRDQVRAWIEILRSRNQLRTTLESFYRVPSLLDLDLAGLEERFRRWGDSFFLLRWFALFTAWRSLAAVREGPVRSTAAEARVDLEQARRLRDLEEKVAALEAGATEVFGRRWNQGDPDPDELDESIRWVDNVRRTRRGLGNQDANRSEALRTATLQVVDAAGEGDAGRGGFGSLSAAWSRLQGRISELAALLGTNAEDVLADLDGAGWLEALEARIGRWQQSLRGLQIWCELMERARAATEQGLGGLVESVLSGKLESRRVRDALDRAVYQAWLDEVVDREDVLRRFRGESHERRIESFRDLDRQCLDLARSTCVARLCTQLPSSRGEGSPKSEMGILQRELQKKKRHKPVRQLFQEISTLLPRLVPCMLMSPLSVAQYLDPAAPPADLVIFDEASQIPVWDAIGSLARGRQAVVVGDPKQLPPTSFFQKAEAPDSDDAGAEENIGDLESILDECLAAQLPRLSLNWHYRSRHESLIAFSNHHYYNGRLVTFPSPEVECAHLGVEWRPVPGGFYDTGKTRTNRAEAESVVEEIVRRLRDPVESKRSIGVVTFSAAQQTLIENLLDEKRNEFEEIEVFFGDAAREPVFVKNLENVQGDERDVMLFSICYGPNQDGRVFMRFGPLNREGGERRLNVAITRAREQLIVFSTLEGHHIDLSRTRWPGVQHLKTFLEYARRGPVAIAEAAAPGTEGGFDSPFEEQVHEALTRKGWRVHPQVGCSGYRIDLGVVHPERPGDYLLGIECDGATYHSAATARDRDRLRQQVLEGLGWEIHRIWSTDWWRDPSRELERIERRLEILARRTGPREVKPSAPPPPPNVAPPGPTAFAGASGATSAEERTRQAALVTDTPPMEFYRTWTAPAEVRPSEEFHEKKATARIARYLKEIVAREAPITVKLATNRLLPIWDLKRATKKAVSRVRKVAQSPGAAEWVHLDDDVLWRPDQDPEAYDVFRMPDDGDEQSKRSADEVPVAEVAQAVLEVLHRDASLPREDLAKEASRLLGYQRSGRTVTSSMDAGITWLIDRGRADCEGDVVRWIRPDRDP